MENSNNSIKNKGNIIQFASKYFSPKAIVAFSIWAYILLICNQSVFANDIQSSKFFKGTKKLLEDATTVLLIIAPILGGLVCIYFFIMKMASDEMDAKKWNGRIKVAIVCVIIAVGFSAFMTIILSYYK